MIEKVENYVDKSMVLRYFQIVFTYFSPVTLIVTTVLTLWLYNYNRKRARLVHLIEKIPGPPALPFIGNAIEINVEHDGKASVPSSNCQTVSISFGNLIFLWFNSVGYSGSF